MNQRIRRMIDEGADPSALGRAAHRIIDWLICPDGSVWVLTPRNDWHHATKRERKLLFGRA